MRGEKMGMRTFWTIWSGQALSLVGSQASQFSLVWWLTLETKSPAVLSTATLVALLPQVVLGPAIGALVDRWSRRITMLVADGAVAIGSLALAGLFLTGRASTTSVLLFLLWRSIAEAFHAPAMMSATSLMVPEEHLGRIQGVNQMLQGGLGIFTAPLGALLLGLLGMTGVMAVDVATALFAMAPLLFVRVPEPERRAETGPTGNASFLGDVGAGLRYLRNLPGHVALIGYAAVINLFLAPAFALLPLLVLQELGGDVGMQAWMTSAFGAGVVVGGLALSVRGAPGSRVRTALASILGLGAATFALGATPGWLFPMAIAAMLVVGIFSATGERLHRGDPPGDHRARIPGPRLRADGERCRSDDTCRTAPRRSAGGSRGRACLVPGRWHRLRGHGCRGFLRPADPPDRGLSPRARRGSGRRPANRRTSWERGFMTLGPCYDLRSDETGGAP